MGVAAILSDARFRATRTTIALLAGIAASSCFAAPAAGAAPNTRITSGPSGLIATSTVTFRFAATGARAKFQCKMDAASWSSCTSPKSYRRLTQGAHTFRVRAIRNRARDASPATRKFTVDSVKPNTTVLSGPTGVIADHNPSFTFSASEPGTFECKLTTAGFAPCTSPFTPAAPIPDESYVFQVRARDAAGNVDATPAKRPFSVNTPIANDLATAQAAAALYFPDTLDLDVPPECGGSPTIDCPGGNPWPAGNQLRIAASRSVLAGQTTFPPYRYDVTATQSVQTLAPIKVNLPLTGDCDVTMTSANGATPTWTVNLSLHFSFDPTFGDLRIVHANTSVTGVEPADYVISGGFGCALAGGFTAFLTGTYANLLESYFPWKLCAAPGPAYLGPCPPP